tara:strand:- start:590 stop:970 length:381 start_codon:yes stop_codon:yes gene_type:complete
MMGSVTYERIEELKKALEDLLDATNDLDSYDPDLAIAERKARKALVVCERKSFNLEEALAGKKVVTIEGDEVTQLIQFESISYPDNIYGVVKGVIVCWNDDGSYSSTSNVKSLYMQDYIDEAERLR